jgi:serine/threonine protein kinase
MPHDFLIITVEPIGKGKSGSVWGVWHWLLAVPLVLKKLTGEQSLMGEWAVQARCAHPNVVRACYYDTDRYHLVLEKMSCSLATFLARQRDPLSDEVILRIATDVLRALLALQSKGVSHNDVKPDNILLITDENDCVTVAKLGDFGSAAGFKPNTRNEGKWKAATAGYLPPEVRHDRVWNGCFVRDLWSLCVSVCAMKFPGYVMAVMANATPDELDRFPGRIFGFLDTAQPSAEKLHANQLAALLRAGLQVDPKVRAGLITAYVENFPL